ncbi:MAG: tetratricopeptide repeat protein, partial [Gammaproteobacteria bacterium]
TEEYVVGDFDNSTFEHNGVKTEFYVRDGAFFTRTDGPDGTIAEFPVRYTFGIDPLQQYIVELNDGRMQALGVAWDSRDAEQGGQRWFHVYGDDPIDHTDVLHWTKMSQSWDSMCADCHSTGLEKRFDLASNQFDTRWSEINVACEACHGPASAHLAWGESGRASEDNGLIVHFDERRDVGWLMNAETGNSTRNRSRMTSVEIDTCAPCHSRRSRIAHSAPPGTEFLDAYIPSLPEPPLYHADGQILDEVYVWGSFMQSRMHQKGVTCSDCHDPHSLELRADGSNVCLQCHLGERFATAEHQLQPAGSDVAAACVDCHMPATTYMQVDARRDHSFRIPRPDLTVEHDTPNACDNCHADKGADWASNVLEELGRAPKPGAHWVDSLVFSHQNPAEARDELLRLATNALAPAIIRATAISETSMDGDPATIALVSERAASTDPLIRWSVARSLQQSHPAVISSVGPKLLNDPVLGVRLETVSAMASLDLELLPQASIVDLQRGAEEYVAAQLVNSERAESHINIGNLRAGQRRFEEAERAYGTALRMNPQFVPGYVNLADLYRALGRDIEGEELLRSALERIPPGSQSSLHHSLGLTLVRMGRLPEAVTELGMAANAADAEPQSVLAYALALDAQGESGAAAEVLEGALVRFGEYPQLVATLVNVYQRMGDEEAASALAARIRNR